MDHAHPQKKQESAVGLRVAERIATLAVHKESDNAAHTNRARSIRTTVTGLHTSGRRYVQILQLMPIQRARLVYNIEESDTLSLSEFPYASLWENVEKAYCPVLVNNQYGGYDAFEYRPPQKYPRNTHQIDSREQHSLECPPRSVLDGLEVHHMAGVMWR